jgi:hypothetical protein
MPYRLDMLDDEIFNYFYLSLKIFDIGVFF